MIRSFSSMVSCSVTAGVLLLAATAGGADETFPVIHNEPITVRILNGKSGRPLARAHLTLIAGYGQRDLHLAMWREEALTDDQGRARLPSAMANLPYLEVKVAKAHLCLADSRTDAFSVERIRRDGLSAPNRCGTIQAEDKPGVFTVYVKGRSGGKKAVRKRAESETLLQPILARKDKTRSDSAWKD